MAGLAVVDIDEAELQPGGLFLTKAASTGSELLRNASRHYQTSIIMQLHKVIVESFALFICLHTAVDCWIPQLLLSSSILGDPAGLWRSVASGVDNTDNLAIRTMV